MSFNIVYSICRGCSLFVLVIHVLVKPDLNLIQRNLIQKTVLQTNFFIHTLCLTTKQTQFSKSVLVSLGVKLASLCGKQECEESRTEESEKPRQARARASGSCQPSFGQQRDRSRIDPPRRTPACSESNQSRLSLSLCQTPESRLREG